MIAPVSSGPERSLEGATVSTFLGLDDGTLLGLWGHTRNEGGADLFGQIYNADGTAKGDPLTLGSEASGFITTLSAVLLGDGRFAVGWGHDSGLGEVTIESAIFGADSTRDGDIIDLGSGYDPRMAATIDGGFAVSLKGAAGTFDKLVDASGAVVADKTLANPSCDASIAVLQNGDVLTVAAVPNAASFYDIVAFRHDPATGEIVSTIVAGSRATSSAPAVTVLKEGHIVVAWEFSLGNGNLLKAQIFTPEGAPVGDEIVVAQQAGSSATSPAVQALADGGFAIAYQRYDTQSDVVLETYAADGTLAVGPTVIGQHPETDQERPSIALLSDGRYQVSWFETADATLSVASQVFDPRNAPVNWHGDAKDEQYGGTPFGDHLDGGGGNDRLYGFDGDDVLGGGAGNDTLDGGGGENTAVFAGGRSNYAISHADDGSTAVSGPDGTDRLSHIRYAQFDDQVVDLMKTDPPPSPSGSTPPPPSGDTPPPVAAGPVGLFLRGTAHKDKLVGHDGNDTLLGLAGNDTLYGYDGNDTLSGSAGNDTLKGLNGNDQLWGGAGRDVLYGGTGKDIFVFDAKPNTKTNLDKITDFNVKDDTLWLDNHYFTKLGKGSAVKPGQLNAKFFTLGDHAKDKDDYLIYDNKKGVLWYDADGSGSHKAVEIATLKKGLKMTYHDVFVI